MSLYLACGLTMAIETLYFFLSGVRERAFLIICLAANAATNLMMNLLLRETGVYVWTAILSEIVVIAAEYAVYCLAAEPTKDLLLHTAIANVLSFSVGGLILTAVLR